MEPHTNGIPDPPDDEIALHAYRLWLQEDCPDGRDREHWLRARKELIASREAEKHGSAPADHNQEPPKL